MEIDTYFIFGVLVLCTAVVCYLALKGRMDSRPVFILMPAATLAVAVLTLLVRTEGHVVLFVLVVSVMGAVVVTLLGVIGFSLVMSMFRPRSGRTETVDQDPQNDGAEHDVR